MTKKIFCGLKSRNNLDKQIYNSLLKSGYSASFYKFISKNKSEKSFFISSHNKYLQILLNIIFPFFIVRLLKIVRNHNVYFFFAGYTFLPIPLRWTELERLRYADLILLKMMGKKIIYVFQGSELRNHDVTTNSSKDMKDKYWSTKSLNNRKKNRLRVFNYCDKILVSTPDLINEIPEEFLAKTEVLFKPLHSEMRHHLLESNLKSKKIRIIHAPTNRAIKGTRFIINAIDNLAQNYPVELVLVENSSRDELFQIAKTCDIAIDQLNVGWYGAFAIEMMSLGLPVLCYLSETAINRSGIEPQSIPLFRTTKRNLENDINNLINNFNIKEIYKKNSEYLGKYHSTNSFDKKIKTILIDLSS